MAKIHILILFIISSLAVLGQKDDVSVNNCEGAINVFKNDDYKNTNVFTNDFGALLKDTPSFNYKNGLLKAEGESGICKVICFSPNHSLTIPDMDIPSLVKVVETWQSEFEKLGTDSNINYVQIFENKGNIMGCSNPHPHGQIWAQSSIPTQVEKTQNSLKGYFDKNQSNLLIDYLNEELQNRFAGR